ncbi:hypothetical protein Tamer19_38240 [Cupriavidus sp. TA19]|nr:hypothetical protein Tamer19_38240 [Cupriavidus sp. TA19]
MVGIGCVLAGMGLAALVAAAQARRAGEAFRDVRLLAGVSATCALAGLVLALDLMGWNA